MSEGSSIGPQLVASFGGKIYDIGILKLLSFSNFGCLCPWYCGGLDFLCSPWYQERLKVWQSYDH